MIKLEKVLKDLGTLIDYWDDEDRFEEHVYGVNILNTLTDARTWIEDTLKEQEPVKPIEQKGRWFKYLKCGRCYAQIPQNERPNYCSNCGKAVKWNE